MTNTKTKPTRGHLDDLDDDVILASLRAWVAADTGSQRFGTPAAVQAFQQMGGYLLARLCDRFERVSQVRAFSHKIVHAIEGDLRRGADPEIAEAALTFWKEVLARLPRVKRTESDDRG